MVDSRRLLDHICGELGLRAVTLGALGVVEHVHGTPCRDAQGSPIDPAGGRIFDPAVAGAVSGSTAITDDFMDGVRRVMAAGLPFESVYLADPARGAGWNSLRVFAPRYEPVVILVRRVASQAEGEARGRQLEGLYRLARLAGAAFWELRPDTGDMYIDPAVKTSLGYAERDIQNHIEAWLALIDPADRSSAEAALRGHLEGRSTTYDVEHRMLARNGDPRWFLVRGGSVDESTGARRVVGLAIDLTSQRTRELEQRTREGWHAALRRALGMGEWKVEIASRELVVDDVIREMLDLHPAAAWSLQDCLYAIHPRDQERVLAAAAKQLDPGAPRDPDGPAAMSTIEVRVRRREGRWRWLALAGRLVRRADGQPVRFVGISLDVTDRRRSQRSARALRRKAQLRRADVRRLQLQLMLAEDTERQRIARELHDDISQRIAAVEIMASLARRDTKVTSVGEALDEIQQRLSALATDVRRISHTMSPVRLPGTYLREQLATYGADLFRTGNLDVRVDVDELPETIPNDIAIALFRIAQEALWNVSRHARTGAATVHLRGDPASLSLEVIDQGSGFDPRSVALAGGMGLMSMKQRVEQFGGTLDIHAEVGAGTKIIAWIPLPEAS